jgi:hypothetical protein
MRRAGAPEGRGEAALRRDEEGRRSGVQGGAALGRTAALGMRMMQGYG